MSTAVNMQKLTRMCACFLNSLDDSRQYQRKQSMCFQHKKHPQKAPWSRHEWPSRRKTSGQALVYCANLKHMLQSTNESEQHWTKVHGKVAVPCESNMSG